MKRANYKKDKQNKVKVKKRFYKKVWFYILMVPIITIVSVGYFSWNKYGDTIQGYIRTGYIVSNNINKDTLSSDKPTIIYDNVGKEIKKLNTYADYQITKENVNPFISKGFVAVEDKRFYDHHGVDPYGTTRSLVKKVMGGGVQGGSTITQQLVKNKVLKNQEQTYSRKITEMVAAQELEKQFSKDDILVSYLNSSWFGNGATGVGAASKYYFNKDQKDVTLREAAIIIGLTNNPTYYDPVNNPENSKIKTNTILNTMLEQNVITQEQYKMALDEDVKITQTQLVNSKDYTDNYAVSYAIQNTAEELSRKDGFKFKYKFDTDEEFNAYHDQYNNSIQESIDKILSGGYKIYTTIDMDLQNKIQNAVNQTLSGYDYINEENNKLNLQVSTTIIDNTTHNVSAIIGGRTTDNDYFNRAYQGFRQPGSTAKPIIAYAPAMMNGDLLPQTSLSDSQVPEYPTVKDWFGGWYNKSFSARDSLTDSLNAPALRAAMMSDINQTTDLLALMEFKNLHPYDNNYIIAIGGFTYGVNTTEMASAYSALSNQGKYVRPSNVSKIIDDYDNETIYENSYNEVQVYTPSASYMTLDMMKSSAVGTTVTAKPALATNYPEKYQAAKTGSTDQYKDAYFVEVTKYYSNAVWIGHDNNTVLNDQEQKLAMLVNGSINNVLLEGKEPKDFDMPDSLSKKGDSFTVLKDDSIKKETNKPKNIELSRRDKVTLENKTRLNLEDYRIIYGLTKDDEEFREKKVTAVLEKIKETEFVDISQYEDLQTQLSSLETLLLDVKSKSAKDKLSKEISEVQENISIIYSNMKIQEQINKEYNNNSKIESARSDVDVKNGPKILELESSLESLKKNVEESYKNNNNIDKSIKDLDAAVTELNKLGKATPYYKLITDGKRFTWIIKEKPTITFQYK